MLLHEDKHMDKVQVAYASQTVLEKYKSEWKDTFLMSFSTNTYCLQYI